MTKGEPYVQEQLRFLSPASPREVAIGRQHSSSFDGLFLPSAILEYANSTEQVSMPAVATFGSALLIAHEPRCAGTTKSHFLSFYFDWWAQWHHDINTKYFYPSTEHWSSWHNLGEETISAVKGIRLPLVVGCMPAKTERSIFYLPDTIWMVFGVYGHYRLKLV